MPNRLFPQFLALVVLLQSFGVFLHRFEHSHPRLDSSVRVSSTQDAADHHGRSQALEACQQCVAFSWASSLVLPSSLAVPGFVDTVAAPVATQRFVDILLYRTHPPRAPPSLA